MRVAILSGMPTSVAMSRAISSCRAFSPSWIRRRNSARWAGGVVLQASKAPRAARTARSASSRLPAGIVAMAASVDGDTTVRVSVDAGATHCPPM
jgi:hypothetical protein